MKRRAPLLLPALCCVVCAGTAIAQTPAQQYPHKPIRWIIPFTPGAGADTVGRILAERLTAALGQPVIVENRGGAGGAIGTDAGAKSPPDGYTWIFGSDPPFTINPHLSKLPFDPQKDFVAVSLLTTFPLVLVVNPTVPARSIKELVALAKNPRSKLTIASSGNGTSAHLAAEYFKSATGAEILHVPYKGQNEALIDVMGGRVDMNFSSVGGVLQNVKAGRLRALGVASKQRVSGLPDVPTIAESGYPGFEIGGWHGLLMPAGTPAAITAKVNEEVSKILKTPAIAEKLIGLNFIPVGGSPQELSRLIASDSEKWGKLIKAAGIRAD
jgi:tripartite-type tricarboxylate transporter receptor subunit TctC